MEITIIHKIGLESSLFALLSAAVSAGQPLARPAAGAVAIAGPAAGEDAASVATAISGADGERDAAGVLWDPERHASTKGKTQAGLWRMKVGVSRPESESAPAAGNPGIGTSAATSSPIATAQVNGVDEDDEFAAFRSAATTTTAPAMRNWTDGDLSKLCNQAALKAGGPEGVKTIITKFVAEGSIPHSRNIAADQRENFAKEVEAAFGIVYEG